MFSLIAIFLCTVFRIIPHAPNFAPVGAMAVFSGRTLPMKWAIPTVLFSLLVGDFFLSKIYGYAFFNFESIFVYGGFLFQMLLGRYFRQMKGGSLIAAITGAGVFFLISNFGVWAEGLIYTRSWAGLIECYIMALPFLKYTLMGNLVWTGVLALGYRLVSPRLDFISWFPKTTKLPTL